MVAARLQLQRSQRLQLESAQIVGRLPGTGASWPCLVVIPAGGMRDASGEKGDKGEEEGDEWGEMEEEGTEGGTEAHQTSQEYIISERNYG